MMSLSNRYRTPQQFLPTNRSHLPKPNPDLTECLLFLLSLLRKVRSLPLYPTDYGRSIFFIIHSLMGSYTRLKVQTVGTNGRGSWSLKQGTRFQYLKDID